MTITIPVFNPSTEEQIAEVVDSDQAIVDAAVARARETFESGIWRKLPAAHRADVLFRAAAIIKERTDELAEIEGRDNGMNVAAARHIITVANGDSDVLRRLGRQDPRRIEQCRLRGWSPEAACMTPFTTSRSSSRSASSA